MEETIQISGLSKSYDGRKVIENLSFSVTAGEVFGLLGANGAGKSTSELSAGRIRVYYTIEKEGEVYRDSLHRKLEQELKDLYTFLNK